MNRLLTEKQIHDILGDESGTTYTDGKGDFVHAVNVWNLLKAQDAKTFRAVGERLRRGELPE